MDITKIVAADLATGTEQYLLEIIDHGIHNLTNKFNGETDEEYEQFAVEFETQAQAILDRTE